ncbi:PTS mannose/fructose/sorbose/N-acetylgalactosamine transporter subunit IIC [Companilactobacillus halodurans]|uniref:PTS sugar transporter subunit IIC n=1 Tax=Companilactobacillus halodurans TaxID=2584183 RepID=A0A5P0ZW69_9LACO|nr:PTS sugar transporter subunit IIC [Companilactobacillus halodurans]MQS75430.1 PTS sugar transporter subunit IIC [Companilactobacillus halodurans]MQS97271.1 PTS sugar transporter subunit IIC [Companilactobacillus halodurans]
MEFTVVQILLLTAYSMYNIYDELQMNSSLSQPVWAGMISGLIMGDMKTGLIIGAALQLTVLGVGTFGGASKIDANSGTVLATAFSVGTGMKAATAVAAIGVPVAALLTSFDILARFANTYFQHKVDKDIENFNYKGIERHTILGALPWCLSRGIPVFLALALGQGAVKTMVTYLNGDLSWLNTGLQTAGATLPAVGFAILLHYLPVKKHIAYLILGFTITALLSTIFTSIQTVGTGLGAVSKSFTTTFNALPMLAIALIGGAFAIIQYKKSMAKLNSAPAAGTKNDSGSADEDEDEDDEFEDADGEVEGDEEE